MKMTPASGNVDNSFDRYRELLLSANKTQNLVSRRSVDRLPELIAESLTPLSWGLARLDSPLLDVGSGGGLPGFPLKLARSDLAVTLLDSNRKKTLFLRRAAAALRLSGVEVVWSRIEDFAALPDRREAFRTITARGVGQSGLLLDCAATLLGRGGELIIWSGELEMTLTADSFEGPVSLPVAPGLALLRWVRK